MILIFTGDGSISICLDTAAKRRSNVFVILRLAGMTTSSVSPFFTSRGIFSPSRMLDKDSVRSSRTLSLCERYSSLIFLMRRRRSELDICSGSPSTRAETLTSMMMPRTPEGTIKEVSFTSAAFSPKIARSSFSSGASSVSDLGVILPTRMSPGLTSAPTRITPS